eukprot:6555149-Pyramimonas_sp.AAC.1
MVVYLAAGGPVAGAAARGGAEPRGGAARAGAEPAPPGPAGGGAVGAGGAQRCRRQPLQGERRAQGEDVLQVRGGRRRGVVHGPLPAGGGGPGEHEQVREGRPRVR